jgi:hypothetical protein
MKLSDDENREKLEHTLEIALSIVEGKNAPHKGCGWLGQLWNELDDDRLFPFYDIAHLQEGHEEFGFFKNDFKEEIVKEAQKLVASLKQTL